MSVIDHQVPDYPLPHTQRTAKVVNIGQEERKIGLSLKRLEEEEEKTRYHEYIDSPKAATSNLGRLLKEELEGRADNLLGGEDKE